VKIVGPMDGFRGRAKITRKITRHSPLVTLTCHLDKGCCLVKAPAGRQCWGVNGGGGAGRWREPQLAPAIHVTSCMEM
jgi:hypothetical protein